MTRNTHTRAACLMLTLCLLLLGLVACGARGQTSATPAALTFTDSLQQRQVDYFPDLTGVTGLVTVPKTGVTFSAVTTGGTGTATGTGTVTFAPTGGSYSCYYQASPTLVCAHAYIGAKFNSWTGGNPQCVFTDATTSPATLIGAYINSGSGHLTLVQVAPGGSVDSDTGVSPAQGCEVRCTFERGQIWAWYRNTSGAAFTLAGTMNLNNGYNYDTASVVNGLHPTWGAYFGGGSGSVVESGMVSGYTGANAIRDFKVVTHKDGSPYTRGGLYYLMATCGNTSTYDGNHTCVISLDPAALTVHVVSDLFFSVGASAAGLYGGCIVYDDDASAWRLYPNGWGFQSQGSGIDEYYATTAADILTPGVYVLPASVMLTGPSGNGAYDGAVRYDSGQSKWLMAASGETSRNVSGPGPVTLYSATAPGGPWTTVATDGGTGEGCNWARIGGTWYVTATGPAYTLFSAALSPLGSVSNWTANFTGLGGYAYSHPCLVDVGSGGNTVFDLVSFDGTQDTAQGSGTIGTMHVLKSQSFTGSEFAPPAAPSAAPGSLNSATGLVSVVLTWAAVPTATGYRVYKDGGTPPVYDGPMLAYTDGIASGTSHAYRVSAYNGVGETAQSGPTTATAGGAAGTVLNSFQPRRGR